MKNAAVIKGLEKRFGSTVALRGVSFTLQAGEMLGVLGPNGAGKTTLIRALAGRVQPNRGTIELPAAEGQRAFGRRAIPAVGVVPQELAIYPDLTARQNLHIFGRLHGLRGADLKQRIAWGLAWSGLENRQHDLVRTFSGGMKRRVNLACGVLHQPPIVLLDEPTVGVDPQSRERIYEMLAQLRGAGTSFLLTTHHLEEAEGRCDRIVIIDHGRVIAAGTLSEIIDSVLGRQRLIRFYLESLPAADYPGFMLNPETRCLSIAVEEIDELPRLMARLQQGGLRVRDVQVNAPDLHAVFLRLTGRELRE